MGAVILCAVWDFFSVSVESNYVNVGIISVLNCKTFHGHPCRAAGVSFYVHVHDPRAVRAVSTFHVHPCRACRACRACRVGSKTFHIHVHPCLALAISTCVPCRSLLVIDCKTFSLYKRRRSSHCKTFHVHHPFSL